MMMVKNVRVNKENAPRERASIITARLRVARLSLGSEQAAQEPRGGTGSLGGVAVSRGRGWGRAGEGEYKEASGGQGRGDTRKHPLKYPQLLAHGVHVCAWACFEVHV